MRTIAHLSDIHFGAVNPRLVAAVRDRLWELRPDYTVVSGDLTQRARAEEYREAKAFIDSLPGQKLVVPGNHDVPLWNVFARFLFPLSGFRRYITRDLSPFLHDEEVAIVGVNTARSLTAKDGRINQRQVDQVCAQLKELPSETVKVLVTHHPFDLSEAHDPRDLVGRAGMAIRQLAAAGADILLAGHLHHAYTGGTAHRYPIDGYSALVVQAGTATSVRLRGSANSFNILRISPSRVEVEICSWDAAAEKFKMEDAKYYERGGSGGMRELPYPSGAAAGT